jgi:curved DNA-binding protein CbpA
MFMVEINTDSLYAVLGVAPDAPPAAIREARDLLIEQARELQRLQPTKRDELTERQKAINAAGEELARPARREKYDRENQHLRFLTVRPAAAPMFTTGADLVAALRPVLADHLDAVGVPLAAASDLDRVDFAADLTWHPLLDEPKKAGPL